MRVSWCVDDLLNNLKNRCIRQGAFDTPKSFCVLNNAECNSQFLSFAFGVFSLLESLSIFRCRSPPLVNLKKIQIDWRKKEWLIDQKEENIKIILIH